MGTCNLFLGLVFGLIVISHSTANAATYYIDYSSGSNSNAGTSKSASWKSHPYMQNCGGSLPSYYHQAGDRFIFKGGVSWPSNCFQMLIPVGGTSSAQDYYGVDQSWYAGSSFTRPKFDLNYQVPTGRSVVQGGANDGGYHTFDNFEITHQGVGLNLYNADAAYNLSFGATGTLITNNYIHDWATTTDLSTVTSVWMYSTGAIRDGHDRLTLDHTEISDAGGYAYSNGVKVFGGFGGACENCYEVRFSKIHDTFAGCFTTMSCHDNEFYNITQKMADLAPARPHSQVVEDDQPCGGTALMASTVYNNLIHDNNAGVNIFVKYNSTIYNNIMWNNVNNVNIRLCGSTSDNTSEVGNIYNNTISCPSGSCVGSNADNYLGTINLKNNHWITDVSAGTSVFSLPVAVLNQSNNVTMSSSIASSWGYTITNLFKPNSSNAPTVGKGANLAGLCSGGLSSLCSDIRQAARGTFWDAGAYQYNGVVTSPTPAPTPVVVVKPNPPTNLKVTQVL